VGTGCPPYRVRSLRCERKADVGIGALFAALLPELYGLIET
jgi:hypothetical protein